MLLQLPPEDGFPTMYLDAVEQIEFHERRYHWDSGARTARMYNGNLVWQPGITLFSALFAPGQPAQTIDSPGAGGGTMEA